MTLLGRLGKDAEIKNIGGNAVANFSMATDRSWKDKTTGEQKKETDWHRVSVWGKTVDNIGAYLRKGREILVEGRLQTRKYKDDAGAERFITEVKADRVVLVGSKPDGDGFRAPPLPGVLTSEFDDSDDPLPF